MKYSVKNNKILCTSHHGLQFSCNPMYITKHLMKKYPNKFEIVWNFKNTNDFEYLENLGIKIVKRNSLEYLKSLMTAKFIITNVDEQIFFPKRKNQFVINTWHGGGSYKTCGFAHPLQQSFKTIIKQIRLKIIYQKYDLYLSSSQSFSEETIRKARLYKGEILEIGMPRNDILINGDKEIITQKVKNHFKINNDMKLALYAPTWRDKTEQSEHEEIDYISLKKSLERKFGGKWQILARKHHKTETINTNNSISAINYLDMQELLVASDVLITDYSSSIWDFSLMYKPIFLFCPDLEIYKTIHNFFSDINTWPAILSQSNKELEYNILNFSNLEFQSKVENHHKKLKNCETGNATKIICDRILAKI
ncbi:CDP-glycerol glycerophosphotransferase family protein [Campylobacter devanensis]|uniref:CDP-glycerol glycerophosphotransferase family protein n=1 Tax=Campylobacter devanensis TaxID=3161138 RepID=UPI00112FA1BD|nr:CDP-glycerol glycerophosphotransferase family protein [Campylobacter sp. P0209]